MFTLTYASSAVQPLPKPELLALLAQAREKNQRLNITGILLYKDGNFLQVLEGEEAEVRQLLAAIKADERHQGLIVLMESEIEVRQFPQWNMAFRHLHDDEMKKVEGYSEFLNMQLTPEWLATHTHEAHALLKVFHKMHNH